MAIKLYDFPYSTNGRKVRLCALELGLDLDVVDVDLMGGAAHAPDYLKLNPNAKVPTLDDGGFVLFESAAIMQYLCEKRPEKNLYPSDVRLRARINQWLSWDGTHFAFEAAFPIYRERIFNPMLKQPRREQIEQAAVENFTRFAAVLNGACEGRPYLVDDRLTIADLALAGTLMYRDAAKLDLHPYPHLRAYIERLEQRDSWRRSVPPPLG